MPRSPVTLLALALFLFASASPSLAVSPKKHEGPFKVLVVQSYNPEYIWTQTINQGMRDSLQGLDAAIDVVYMDAKRKPAPEHLKAVARTMLERIERESPDVVVTVDDAAQAYLAEPYLRGRKAPQVIFCGVNAPLRNYGFPASNVSGVRERWHYREGFELLRKILPSLRSVALFMDTSESSGYVIEDLMADMHQFGPFALNLVGIERVKTFQEWQKLVRSYQTRADALALGLYNSLLDEKTGKIVPPEEVSAWTNSVNTKPTVGFSDIAKENGALCGVLESGHEQGFLAGQMVRELLTDGGEAGRFEPKINVKGVILVNVRTAERLGVRIPYSIIEAAGMVVQ